MKTILEIPGYYNLKQIHESKTTLLFRAKAESDGKKVIIKKLKSDYPSLKDIANLKNSYLLLKKLEKSEEVIKPVEFIEIENTFALVIEDDGWISLDEWKKDRECTVEEFLKIAINVAKNLAILEPNHIIHKDVNPNNIIIDPKSLSTKLIDFCLSSELDEETLKIEELSSLEGTLHYISPEQTGRMNRPLDYRSDFYSMGVTLFELACGRRPFETKDPVELIYHHITTKAPGLTDFAPQFPKQISSIIAKLLDKDPDSRYQSAEGLKKDLITSLNYWNQSKQIPEFVCGSSDFCSTLHISHKLYGRAEEIQSLMEIFEIATEDHTGLVVVSGYSGVGKTSLVMELQKKIVEKNGMFISGKFDQLKKNTPLYPFSQCFKTLTHYLLTLNEKDLAEWKERIQMAVGKNGQILTNLVEDLTSIIGKQEDLADLSFENTQERLISTATKFIQCFAKKEQPLVIFIDDLQWADSLSLSLIEDLISNPQSKNLLLIGAYRDNEVNRSHPLMLTLQNIKKGRDIQEISLKPLKERDVTHLIGDTFKTDEVTELSSIIFKKTNGNPFFINELIKLLNKKNLIFFNYEQKKWDWDLDQIEKSNISNNVAEVVVQKIDALSKKSQEILKLASCFGDKFSFHELKMAGHQTIGEIAKDLWELLENGLIIPLNKNYKQLHTFEEKKLSDPQVEKEITFKFLHDRIQQAAYDSQTDEQKEKMHFQIGMQLIKEHHVTAESELNQQVFDILNHSLRSLSQIKLDRLLLAKLFLKGGVQAKRSVAYQQAIKYFKGGLQLLAPHDWMGDYTLLFSLFKELAESEYLVEHFDQTQALCDEILNQSQDNFDKAKIYYILLDMYLTKKETEKAVGAGINALKLLGVKIPKKLNGIKILFPLFKILLWYKWHGEKKLNELPVTQNPQVQLAAEILVKLVEPTYRMDEQLMAYFVLVLQQLILKYGINDISPLALTIFSSMIYKVFPKSNLSLNIIKQCDPISEKVNDVMRHRRLLTYYVIHCPREKSFEAMIEGLRKCCIICQEAGDHMFSSYAIDGIAVYLLMNGKKLDAVLQDALAGKAFRETYQKSFHVQLSIKLLRNIEYLMGKRALTDKELAEDIQFISEDDVRSGAYIYSQIGMMNFWMGKKKEALTNLTKFYEIYKKSEWIEYGYFFWFLFYISSLVDVIHELDPKTKKLSLGYCREMMKKMVFWNQENREIYGHPYALFMAEYLRLFGKEEKIQHFYDQTIEIAKNQDCPMYVALANERAGRWFLSKNLPKFAKSYIEEAEYYYTIWGCPIKQEELAQEFPNWISKRDSALTLSAESSVTSNTTSIDLISILKASQSISREMVTEKLLYGMIKIVLENSVAQKGVFLISKQNRIFVAAEGRISERKIDINTQRIAIDNKEDLPKSVIAYVFRTNKPLILDHAALDATFKNDSYIKRNQVKSILCIPIEYRGETSGYLYLENNASEQVFTQSRIEMIKILATQTAISLENASIYEATARFVPNQFLTMLKKKNLTEVQLGDQIQKQMTVLFSDIRNFTSLSEGMNPEENFTFINDYLAAMEPIITKNNGFIDKYIGDAIMALFENADDALQAAMQMQEKLVEFNQARVNKDPVAIGIGLNSGDLMLGIIGGKMRIDGSVIGDAVNTASRVESLTKEYQAKILITDDTRDKLSKIPQMTKRGDISIKGKAKPIGIWELM
jgi:predicted ATPase/class 3 adenylate cyclase/GAF domain-containing protein